MTFRERNTLSDILAQWRRRMVELGWIRNTIAAAGDHYRAVWVDE